jgi:NAD-dependent deacetylase
MRDLQDAIQQARNLLQAAQRVFVITGAGISAESGVPTFRDPGGLWKNFKPEEVATPQAFRRDPVFVWQWYDDRRTRLQGIVPNPGHFALAELEKKIERCFLLTQNVDDLHEQAGSRNLAHIHGSIWETRCTHDQSVRENRETPLATLPPRCPRCGAIERPNVVWFGEAIDRTAVDRTEHFLGEGEADAVLVIGTEASFPYIGQWAQFARGARGRIIEVNLGRTALTPLADLHLRGSSGEILPQIAGM